MTTELKPCPFCGGTANVYNVLPRFNFEPAVVCDNCFASVARQDEQYAIESWNMRVSDYTLPTMDDAVAAADGTLHVAIDYWQEQADARREMARILTEALEVIFKKDRECNSGSDGTKSWRIGQFAQIAIAALIASSIHGLRTDDE